ncbi:hypothetical protein FJ938_26525 [Mesorhizobium sp. B2-4-14]|uniref:hypothetical protein n=1 Tax=Mesorhizobium sp. B2-4-14 TaxID=2589935 RepID=UPI001126C23B|nr:hypothetical protein [Mesorhizobium sp. B2-4-14]TPK97346.1 hypothetical protein FJ938_26525 [Mesorhizobium sp. B2-4-14]
MHSGGGFYSDEQECKFRAASIAHRRGGIAEIGCGARTRTGGTCRQKPLVGSKRCLRHAGPHAARAFRERQIRELSKGRITPAEFQAYEARRAANRLRDNWKKNPWLFGSTIDLGPHEHLFQAESGLAHREVPTAPAIVDWLRWKYRRLQIDRKRDAEWLRVLWEDLPRRIEAAGVPALDDLASVNEQTASPLPGWTADHKNSVFSKRRNQDRPKVKAPPNRDQLARLPKGKFRVEASGEEIAALWFRHGSLLRRLFEKCRDDKEKSAVVAALYSYDRYPNESQAAEHWADVVRVLNTSGR